MKVIHLLSLSILSILVAACNQQQENSVSASTSSESSSTTTQSSMYYQTKTPYQPQQSISSYEAAPTGFSPVFTELVARHGSRGLSSMKYDLALYNLWLQAKADNALTPLGEKLGADLETMMKVNILLGDGVEGISTIGYGNESALGIAEHRGIADRLLQRLPTLFQDSSSSTGLIKVQSSGVDRAVDSAKFFSNELIQKNSALAAQITPVSYASLTGTTPSISDGGVNRFLLYFHSLNATSDLSLISTDEEQQIYDASLAYQDFEDNNTDLATKLSTLAANTELQTMAETVLSKLFTQTFIDKIGSEGYLFSNTGSFSATTAAGEEITVTGKGKNIITSSIDAAAYLYELYSIAAGLKTELGNTDFSQYMPLDAAQFYAEYNDANDFYEKGPSFSESNAVTSTMAMGLKNDFFYQVDAVINKVQPYHAVLRFAHAEIIIPLATAFDLKGMMSSLPFSTTYTYQNSTWRGEDVSPMAANMQWDIYQNAQGVTLVKMLYNEKETLFKASCDYARYQSNSYYYDYQKLRLCYAIN